MITIGRTEPQTKVTSRYIWERNCDIPIGYSKTIGRATVYHFICPGVIYTRLIGHHFTNLVSRIFWQDMSFSQPCRMVIIPPP
jgi:hypothetical protein